MIPPAAEASGPDLVPLRRALVSVSDKAGLMPFVTALAARGVEILSTGGTAGLMRDAGITVREVADLTGMPEMMDGRVKTLHPRVHGGLLALRDRESHQIDMAANGIEPIDLLVVNLYPFEATVAGGADYSTVIENIDIGGPAMLRAAAKNHGWVAVVTDPEDYGRVLAELDARDGCTGLALRQRLALAAYGRTAAYDAAVCGWLAGALGEEAPRRRAIGGRLVQTLRYGENPHQSAAFYADGSGRAGVATARQWQGKELSYNNINDTDAAWECLAELGPDQPACVIVKHANPCGAAVGATPAEAYARAFDCDRTSAFGGIVAVNRPLDAATAEAITAIFTEVVIAPEADEGARAVFAGKPNLRLLTAGAPPDPAAPWLSFRQVSGGFLVQGRDTGRIGRTDLRVVTARAPSDGEIDDLLFAWRVAKHVKSNAIVFARGGATVGIGAGQMSRVDSTRIAVRKAEDMAAALGLAAPLTEGAAVASDAFFPFADGIEALAAAGARAVIQPGGAMRDADVIAAADAAGIAMVFTGMRHFRH